eukprot:754925-Hanusia_phi.AAC.2
MAVLFEILLKDIGCCPNLPIEESEGVAKEEETSPTFKELSMSISRDCRFLTLKEKEFSFLFVSSSMLIL